MSGPTIPPAHHCPGGALSHVHAMSGRAAAVVGELLDGRAGRAGGMSVRGAR